MSTNKNIKIEKVSDINFEYPYLEVFFKNSKSPFLDVSINSKKELVYKFYKNIGIIELSEADFNFIITTSKEFFIKSINDQEDFKKVF